MEECPQIEFCPFFNDELPQPTATIESLKESYCRDDYEKCARYRIAIDYDVNNVPFDMFPFEQDKVEKVKAEYLRQVMKRKS